MKNTDITIRPAEQQDLPEIIRLFHDDDFGPRREILPDPHTNQSDLHYVKSLGKIQAQDGNDIFVAEIEEGRIVGVMQLIIIPHLNRTGAKRAQIEGVHVAADYRGKGIGSALTEFALEKAGDAGCKIVQLTSHIDRKDAHRFYEAHGFVTSHHGMKLYLEEKT